MKLTMFKKKLIISCLLIGSVACAHGADLLQVYQQALANDQTFQSDKATYEAATQQYPIALSAILPEIGLTGQATTDATRNFAATDLFPANISNKGYTYTLSASQPLIDFGSLFNVHAANDTVKQAAANYAAAAQDLLLRTASAYFNVLQAEDTLRFTEAENEANKRQLDQAEQRFKVGLDAITSVYDAQASYDGSKARVIAAKNDVQNTKEQLREITDVFYNNLAKLKKPMPLISPKPKNVETWVQKADHYNFSIQAAKYAMAAARENIKVAFAGHLPTLDLTGNITRNRFGGNASGADADSFGRTNNRIETAGLSLNLPIFQGGLVNANVRQEQYNYENAVAQLEQTHRSVSVQLRQTYNSIIAGISLIKADKQTVKSRLATLRSTEAALQVGTRTIVDLLLAQSQLFEAQNTLAIDQYTYINNTLQFKQLAGTLTYRDLVAINSWLRGQKSSQSPYKNPDSGQSLLVKNREAAPIVNHITNNQDLIAPIPKFAVGSPHPKKQTTQSTYNKTHSSNAYTVQLMAMHNEHTVNQFIKQHHLQNRAKIYKTQVGGKTWYQVFYGEYASKAKAYEASQQLPKALAQNGKIWVRQLPK